MHWLSGKHVTCCDFAKRFHLYIIQFLKYRQTQVSSIRLVFVFLSHSLLALLCLASICFKRACLIIKPPPHHTPTKSARTSTIWTGVLLFTFLRKIAAISSETILFHVMPLQNDRSLSKPYKMGCCFLFLLHMPQKVWPPDCAEYICASIYTFSVPPLCPYKVRGPRRNSYNMVWCFVLFPAHI